MYILKVILDDTGNCGQNFLVKEFIESKYDGFLHAYEFDKDGNIIKQTPRHFTERSKNEIARFTRIAFEAVYDYAEKENRHLSSDLTNEEQAELKRLCMDIPTCNYSACSEILKQLISRIQKRIIQRAITAPTLQ